MYLIAGLGNPGREYEATRHNLGFRTIDELAARLAVKAFRDKHQSLIAEAAIGGTKVLLVKPQTFMNNSGLAVQAIAAWHKIDSSKIIIIYDDADLPAGQIRVREKGTAGGHHGMESVIGLLGSTAFPRVRLGLGREDLRTDITEYVLQKIPSEQRELFADAIITAAEAAQMIVASGVAAAMNKYNS